MPQVLCVDFGSTFTKAAVVQTSTGAPLATASVPTTADSDVLDGYHTLRRLLDAHGPVEQVFACSSAGGGLRLAVTGYEAEVTAQAGHRVGLSAGATVVHVASGPLSAADVAALRHSRPDIVLLVGGTDGGNADVLLHNAARLSRARVTAPMVVAGNAVVADEVSAVLSATGRRFVVTENVLPQIGVIAPEGARAAIREVFLRHVIGGKGLSRGPRFARMVRAATPDAMLSGVQVLAEVVAGDVMVIDVGGATTDVYSAVSPWRFGRPSAAADGRLGSEVVAPLLQARTVEADLGMRWSAKAVVEAAVRERLTLSPATTRYAARVAREVGHLPADAGERGCELELAGAAAVVAARRHGRPVGDGEQPRPLMDVCLLVGSGGVLRHAEPGRREDLLAAVLGDHGGGWRVPEHARTVTDTAYLLFAVGLLSRPHPRAARALAERVAGWPS